MGAEATVRVQRGDFDVATEIKALGGAGAGAIVTFTGLCRDEGGKLSALELEHYPGMAEAEISRIAKEAIARWPVTGVTIIHRYGRLEPGDNIVLVVTASAHRQAAFEAANFLMDFLKTRAPFWKKEHLADGGKGEWVSAKDADDKSVEKWKSSIDSSG